MMRKALMIFISFFIAIVLLCIAPGIEAQDELVVACLDAPLDDFGDWQNIIGYDISIDYMNGDFPSDWHFLPDVVFETSNGLRYLWVVAAPSTPGDIYVFPFRSMELSADAHIHPCDVYHVTDYPIGLVGG